MIMDQKQSNHSGSILGGTLLVAGSCIGSAMLGLPITSGPAGFWPSVAVFLLAFFFMLSTGLLLLEVNLWYGPGVSISTMVQKTLGKTGRWVAGGSFAFLFYSLMVAIISGSGQMLASVWSSAVSPMEPWVGGLIITVVFGALISQGTRVVDYVNRFFMAGIIFGYGMLLYVGWGQVKPELLTHTNWSVAVLIMPVMVISFGFHNLVPSLTLYLKARPKPLVKTLIFGSLLTLAVNLLWNWIVLGTIPVEGAGGILAARDRGLPATEVIRVAAGVGDLSFYTDLFAFSALITTFVGVGLSFVHFLDDALQDRSVLRNHHILCGLVMVPPFLIYLVRPDLFLTALNYAGGFGVMILFGILPVWMVWRGRYQMGMKGPRLLPGGRLILVVLLIISLGVMGLELAQELGISVLPVSVEAQP